MSRSGKKMFNADGGQMRIEQNNNRIVWTDGSNDRTLFGQDGDFFGIKQSKDGIDVIGAADEDLIFKDDFATRTYLDDTDSRILTGFQSGGF